MLVTHSFTGTRKECQSWIKCWAVWDQQLRFAHEVYIQKCGRHPGLTGTSNTRKTKKHQDSPSLRTISRGKILHHSSPVSPGFPRGLRVAPLGPVQSTNWSLSHTPPRRNPTRRRLAGCVAARHCCNGKPVDDTTWEAPRMGYWVMEPLWFISRNHLSMELGVESSCMENPLPMVSEWEDHLKMMGKSIAITMLMGTIAWLQSSLK